MSDKITLSATILITGLVVVFAVLFLLIFIIKIYGKIFTSINDKNSKDNNSQSEQPIKKAEQNIDKADKQQSKPAIQTAIPNEIIAVIAAAVTSMYGQDAKIKSVTRLSKPDRSAWFKAGVMNNTRPF